MTFRSLGFFASSGARAKPGMVLLKPTSVDHSGTSASIGANGQVTFTAVTSLSLNGVFSATYDNYAISMRHVLTSGDAQLITMKLRASGTDTTGSDYTRQALHAYGSTIAGLRQSSQTSFRLGDSDDSQRSGTDCVVYGPFLAQPTAMRDVGISGYEGAYLFNDSGTHSLSSSYDGFTIAPASSSLTGALQVYGIRS